MPKPANYFRIGLFILLGVFILVVGLLIFGGGQFFKEKVIFETYVRKSVQGVDVGSPVKFRGVQIGKVSWVGFTFNTYPRPADSSNRNNFVIIRMQIDKEIFPNMFNEDLQAVLERGVEKGLRVRIEPQGITGMNYMEINFVDDPKQYPLLTFDWKPEYDYIPSAPGELTDILDSTNKIMRDMEKLNVEKLQNGLSDLLTSLNKAVGDAQIQKISQDIQSLMQNVNSALTEANIGPLSNETRALLAGLQKSNDELHKILKNLEPATRLDPSKIRAIVKNLEDVSANLEEFSASIKQRPHLLLYGTPPKPKPSPTPRRR